MTPPATQVCPSCGAQTSGKFCSECGASLARGSCSKCGARLSARAKFCPECGTPTAGGGRAPVPPRAGARSDRTAWYVAGAAVLGLLVVIVVLVGRKSVPPSGAEAPTGAPGRAVTDLSTMSPREQADRLYNRIMILHEAGKADSVSFFAPMALQAYANLGSDLDADARLHLGLVELAIGQADAAAAQGDTIIRRARTHLFGWLLEGQAALSAGDSASARRAFRAFLQNYQSERGKSLPEYGEHAQMLEDARSQAQRLVAATAGN
jgi:hypothetical protein